MLIKLKTMDKEGNHLSSMIFPIFAYLLYQTMGMIFRTIQKNYKNGSKTIKTQQFPSETLKIIMLKNSTHFLFYITWERSGFLTLLEFSLGVPSLLQALREIQPKIQQWYVEMEFLLLLLERERN